MPQHTLARRKTTLEEGSNSGTTFVQHTKGKPMPIRQSQYDRKVDRCSHEMMIPHSHHQSACHKNSCSPISPHDRNVGSAITLQRGGKRNIRILGKAPHNGTLDGEVLRPPVHTPPGHESKKKTSTWKGERASQRDKRSPDEERCQENPFWKKCSTPHNQKLEAKRPRPHQSVTTSWLLTFFSLKPHSIPLPFFNSTAPVRDVRLREEKKRSLCLL